HGDAQFEKGDVIGAEGTWKTLPITSSARPALLGHCAYAKRDVAAAEELYRDAFKRGERGLVTTRLAEIVGGEARSSAKLGEAVKFIRDGGGDAELASALDDARGAWEAHERGDAAPALLPRAERAQAAAPTYASLAVLRAEMLDRRGDHDKA